MRGADKGLLNELVSLQIFISLCDTKGDEYGSNLSLQHLTHAPTAPHPNLSPATIDPTFKCRHMP